MQKNSKRLRLREESQRREFAGIKEAQDEESVSAEAREIYRSKLERALEDEVHACR